MAVCGRRLRGGVHVEGHPVSQVPSVAGRGVCTGLEQSRVAAVAVQVLVSCPARSDSYGAGLEWVDGEDGHDHSLGRLPEALPNRLTSVPTA